MTTPETLSRSGEDLSPSPEVKAAVTGSGRADKAQVTTMITRILDLDEAPRPADAADALALAVCHLWRPAGALQGGDRHELTPAQRAWAAAEQAAKQAGQRRGLGAAAQHVAED